MNGVFAVNKPSGPTSRDVVNKLKVVLSESPTFTQSIKNRLISGGGNRKPKRRLQYIKIGHGGTLDPLADGVLVIGVGSGTKMLQKYLGECTKTYRATAVFGVETSTFDSEGKVTNSAPVSHLTKGRIEEALLKFKGEIEQIPPIYSALKMNGKPLYQYARSGEELPKEIQPRKCTVSRIEVIGDVRFDHEFVVPEAENEEGKDDTKEQEKEGEKEGEKEVKQKGQEQEEESPEKVKVEEQEPTPVSVPTAAVDIEFSVSSGTYIRTLINDIGKALDTYAYMAKLTRLSQGDFHLKTNVLELNEIVGKTPQEYEPKLLEMIKAPVNR